jgi:hypothetical protein
MRRVPSFLGALVLSVIVAQPSSAGSPTGNSTGGVLPPEPGSGQDQAFVIAKEQGRVRVHPDGRVEILSTAPVVSYASNFQLDTTTGTGKFWEPQGSGTDNAGIPYTDNNYWNFCGPGATAVTLWYWPAGNIFDTTIATQPYTEPNASLSIKATTTWAATDAVSKGRGAIMYLAEKELPKPGGTPLPWAHPGVIDWTSSYPNDGTPVDRIRDALNWEISGGTATPLSTGPYAWVPYTSSLTQGALHTDVQRDIAGQGTPLVANVATSSGRYNLPNWGKRGSVNHSITIVGYDDAKGTYTYIDTCGPGCNNSGAAAGVYTVSQQTLWALLGAETDHDGIIW